MSDRRLADVLARVREDLSDGAGAAFTRVAADYLAAAAAAAGPVAPPPVRALDPYEAPSSGESIDDVSAALRAIVVDGANRLWHPMYMGHQVAAPLPAAIWSEPVIAALNQSLAVREMSPSATRIELGLIRWMCGLVWGAAGEDAAGTFTSGGTEAIFTALLAARNAALPAAAVEGVRGPAAIVCGEHAHYAVRRAAGQLGIGSRGVVLVPSKDRRMDVAALTRTLERLDAEHVPVVAVVATAGSTATGAFDDLEGIGSLCAARRLWLHVDAAHGGSALLSARHRHRLRGIEHAQSISWDPHKMMLVPLSAGVVLVRSPAALGRAFGQDAPYLFAPDDVVEQGTRSFMCSRRADAVKVWVVLRRYGIDGLAALYEALCDRAVELHGLVAAHPAFEPLHEPEANILCFRFVGDAAPDDPALDERNLALRERWNASGAGWITTTVLEGRRVLRVVVMNPLTERQHVERTVDGLAALGRAAPFATQNGVP